MIDFISKQWKVNVYRKNQDLCWIRNHIIESYRNVLR